MNEILCPRCGHEHGDHWGDDLARGIGDGSTRCHTEMPEIVRGDAWCRCTMPLSSALAAQAARKSQDSLRGVEASLYDLGRSLERMGATLEIIAQVLEVRR